MMSRTSLLSSLCVLLAAVPAAAQIAPSSSSPLTPQAFPAPSSLLNSFSLSTATIQDLRVPMTSDQSFEVSVVLGGQVYQVRFWPHDIRSPDFKLLVDDGNGLHQIPTPPSVTYRGEVVGNPDAVVAGSVIQGQLEAIIGLDDATWGIEPASRSMPSLPLSSHIVYRNSDNTLHGTCGVTTTKTVPVLSPTANASTLKQCEIALDLSHSFYTINGSSTTNAQNAASSIVNGGDVIYMRDVGVTFSITQMIVRTTTVYTSNNPNTLLNQFQSRWNSQHGSVVRDTAHLFAGNPGSSVIGIAYLGVICNKNSAYGVTWWLGSFTQRVGVFSHEVGHNFNAPHCDGINPCWIMCSGLGGCNGIITKFAPTSIGFIQPFANSRGCLSNVASQPPTISSITPTTVNGHNGGTVSILGTNLNSLQDITVGTVNITSFTTVSSSQVDFALPDPFEINSHTVTVTNSAGTSNGVTLNVTGSHPSVLDAPALHPHGFSLPYSVYTDRNWKAVLFVSSSNAPSVLPGLVSMGIGSNFSSLFQVITLPTNTAGFAQLNLLLGGTISPQTLYWQAVTFDPSNPALPFEVSNVESVNVF